LKAWKDGQGIGHGREWPIRQGFPKRGIKGVVTIMWGLNWLGLTRGTP